MYERERKRLAHPPPVERFNEPTVVFLTVASKDREAHYDNDRAHESLLAAWERANQWRVVEYLLMPDHMHLFCIPGVLHPEPIKKWARYWKRLAAQKEPALKGTWQDDVWDRQIRTLWQFDEKRSYVRMNPVRANLCASPEDWPYAGVLRDVLW